MAVIKNYFRLDANLGYRHLGDLKIYLTKPQISYLLYNDSEDNYVKSSLNGVTYIDQSYNDKTDFKGLSIYYNWQYGTESPTKFANGASVTVNPVLPIETSIGPLVRPNDPEGGYGSTSLYRETTIQSIFHNNEEGFLGIFNKEKNKDEWNLSLNRVLIVDNIFNRGKPQFTVINPGTTSKYVEIKMTEATKFNSLANLIIGSSEINTDDINQYIPFDSASSTYRLPWGEEGVDRSFGIRTHIPSYTHSVASDDDYRLTTTSFNGNGDTNSIIFFNDELRFVTHQLGNIRSMSRNGKVLSWTSVSNAQSYSIYVDGNLYDDNVTTTSWTIPDELYYDNFHSYSISVNSYTTKAYQIMTVSGKATSSSSVDTFPMLRRSTFNIYSGTLRQEPDNWKNIGILNAPTYTYTKDKLNQYTITLSDTSLIPDTKYYYIDALNPANSVLTPIEGNQIVFERLQPNVTYQYLFYVGANVNGTIYYSDSTSVSFTPTKLPITNITGMSKTSINSYAISFSNPSQFRPDRYRVFLNNQEKNSNASSPVLVSGWKANQENKIKIEAVYEEDTSYNSVVEVTSGAAYTPILRTPTLSKKDIKENNVTQSFGDDGSKEILNNVTTKVELSWTGIEYASGYILYDNYKVWNNDVQDWEEGLRTFPTQATDPGTEYMSGTKYTITMDNVQGYHTYTVQAIAADDESYSSEISNEIYIEQNFPLDAPVVTYDSETTTISFDKVNNADFYSIQLIPTRGTSENLFRSFIPETFPFVYNYYDMVKDLRETDTFIISVFSRSYNAFYYHPSADSNHSSVNVYKLNTPTNLNYDDTTGKLTWTGDSRAFQYEIKIKATDGDWVTYNTFDTEFTFENLAPSLYTLYITALRDDSLTNNQPVYLDSEKSENLSFGLLNIPKDFSRHINKFSWTSVGADRYILYEDGKSLTTVDGGGTSLDLGMVSGAKYRPTPGNHTYTVQAVTTIDDIEYRSLQSEPITVDIVYLQTLEPYYTTSGYSHISWEEKDLNVLYDTRVNNISEKDLTNENIYTMDKNNAGIYYFKVRSISTIDEFLYQTSEFSEEIPYSVFKLNRPDVKLTITPDEVMDIYDFTWEPLSNATSYTIIIDKDGESTENLIETTSYRYFPTAGNYTIRVYANGSLANYPNPKYVRSDSSNIIRFGKLEAPHIDISENVISWEANPLADYYEIYNYGELFSSTEENLYVLNVENPYSYSISIRAVSNEENVMDSNLSNSIEYVVTRLRNPQNVKLQGNSLTWDMVLNADSYRVYIDGSLVAITSSLKYDLTRIFEETAGILKIHVTAISNKLNFLESEDSNYVIKRITKSSKFNLVIDGVNYDKLQLPFAIHETLDETLDTACVTISYIDRKDPFEKLTPAAIIIYEGSTQSKAYKMIVESDDVTEVQIGDKIRYKHTVQLIERTLIMQNEIVPDFTITTSVIEELKQPSGLVKADLGGNTIPGTNSSDSNNIVANGNYNMYTIRLAWLPDWLQGLLDIPDNLQIPLGFINFFGLSDSIKAGIKSRVGLGETISLPLPISRLSCYNMSIKEIIMNLATMLNPFTGTIKIITNLIDTIKYAYENDAWGRLFLFLLDPAFFSTFEDLFQAYTTDNDWPYPARNYYIRPHNPSYSKTSDEELIGSFGASLNAKNLSYTFTKEGSYDLIMEIPAVNFKDLYDRGLITFDEDYKVLYGNGVNLPTNVNYMRDKNGNPTTFRIVWHNITVAREVDKKKYYTIAEVLEKICALKNNKFSIDPVITAITSNMKCPDLTFSGGNYLYDVLETIGREFNGIPRLLEDNIITFDILDEYNSALTGINGWRDDEILSARAIELDKASSGYISRLSNMVPEEDITIYPAPGMWQYARGDADSTATVDIENLSIKVDKPIYKINKVIVKNAIKGLTDFEIDITDYVYEKSVYNALNDNHYGKGMALVWTQGDRYIKGLGQIPEAEKLYAILGWASDEYVIENIINNYIENNMATTQGETYYTNNPNDMLFRVEYQGYTNTMVYIENPDKRYNKYNLYQVLNQEDNTITDSRFGNSALVQLKRHGGNRIQKSYDSYTVTNIPRLGSTIKDGNTTYYLDEVKYTFHNSYIESSCNFTKNYNKINPRVAIDSSYRQYELVAEKNVDRYINFNQYCYIGEYDSRQKNNALSYWAYANLYSLTKETFDKPDSFYFNCYNSDDLDQIQYVTSNDSGAKITSKISGIALPVSYNRIGTSINFSCAMEDSFSAGRSIRRKSSNPKNESMLQSFVRYVGDDSQNQIPLMRVTIGSLPNNIKTAATASYPSVNWLSSPESSLTRPYFSKLFKVYKDQREALSFNYQMHFISNQDDLLIHKGYTKYLFKNANSLSRQVSPILVTYNGTITNKDILDIQYEEAATCHFTLNKIYFSNKVLLNNDYTGIALIWPDTKEILFEIQRSGKADSFVDIDDIYFNFSNEILNN